jgi:hypothetical protein
MARPLICAQAARANTLADFKPISAEPING